MMGQLTLFPMNTGVAGNYLALIVIGAISAVIPSGRVTCLTAVFAGARLLE